MSSKKLVGFQLPQEEQVYWIAGADHDGVFRDEIILVKINSFLRNHSNRSSLESVKASSSPSFPT